LGARPGQITDSAPKIVDVMTVAGASAGDHPAGCLAVMFQSRPPVAPLLARFSCRRARFRVVTTETDRLGQRRAPRRIAWRGQWIIPRQLPTGAAISGFEAMGDPQMAAKHFRVIPALEANDVNLLDRASDRNRRFPRLLRRCCTPETGERAMHLADQSYITS
jgi:hypothetical protein